MKSCRFVAVAWPRADRSSGAPGPARLPEGVGHSLSEPARPALRRLALLLPLALTGLADFGPPALSGGGWQGGGYLPFVPFVPFVPFAGVYVAPLNLFGLIGASAGRAVLGDVVPAPGSATLPLSGAALWAAGLLALGTLRHRRPR